MKRLFFVGGVALGLCAMLAASAPVWAHVTVSPEEVSAGDYETLNVSVPTEKEVPTTEIRVEVPEGFLLSGVQPVPGWEHSFEEDGGLITAVTWSVRRRDPPAGVSAVPSAGAGSRGAGRLPVESFPDLRGRQRRRVGRRPRFRGAGFCGRCRLRRL
jgi:Domain of unkown function (DUF1775)